jgi:hypothetical protein
MELWMTVPKECMPIPELVADCIAAAERGAAAAHESGHHDTRGLLVAIANLLRARMVAEGKQIAVALRRTRH